MPLLYLTASSASWSHSCYGAWIRTKKAFGWVWHESKEKGCSEGHCTRLRRDDLLSLRPERPRPPAHSPSIAEYAVWQVCFQELHEFLPPRLLVKSCVRRPWQAKTIHNSNPILSVFLYFRDVISFTLSERLYFLYSQVLRWVLNVTPKYWLQYLT